MDDKNVIRFIQNECNRNIKIVTITISCRWIQEEGLLFNHFFGMSFCYFVTILGYLLAGIMNDLMI